MAVTLFQAPVAGRARLGVARACVSRSWRSACVVPAHREWLTSGHAALAPNGYLTNATIPAADSVLVAMFTTKRPARHLGTRKT
jgi:hypothetical protein